jgi:hypothetical protein
LAEYRFLGVAQSEPRVLSGPTIRKLKRDSAF